MLVRLRVWIWPLFVTLKFYIKVHNVSDALKLQSDLDSLAELTQWVIPGIKIQYHTYNIKVKQVKYVAGCGNVLPHINCAVANVYARFHETDMQKLRGSIYFKVETVFTVHMPVWSLLESFVFNSNCGAQDILQKLNQFKKQIWRIPTLRRCQWRRGFMLPSVFGSMPSTLPDVKILAEFLFLICFQVESLLQIYWIR